MDIVQNLRNEITTLKTILKSLLPEICANGSINDLSYLLSNINVNDLAQHMIISLFDHAIPIISWDKNKDYILSRIEIFKLLRKKFNDQYELWSVYNKNKSFMCLFKNSIENFVDIVDEKQLSLRFEMFKTLREYFQDEYDVFLLKQDAFLTMFSFFISQIKPDNVDVPHNIELLRILAHLFNREHDLILEKSWSLYSILFTKFLPKFTPDEAIDYIIPKLEMFKLLKTIFLMLIRNGLISKIIISSVIYFVIHLIFMMI